MKCFIMSLLYWVLYHRTIFQWWKPFCFFTEKLLKETNCEAQQSTPNSPECKVRGSFIKHEVFHQVKCAIVTEIFSIVAFNVFISSPVSLKMWTQLVCKAYREVLNCLSMHSSCVRSAPPVVRPLSCWFSIQYYYLNSLIMKPRSTGCSPSIWSS